MEEIFEIIKAINRLKEKISELSAKFDSLLKTPAQQPESKYADEESACKRLNISPRTLAKLRALKKIPYIKNGHKIRYLVSDLDEYLTHNLKR